MSPGIFTLYYIMWPIYEATLGDGFSPKYLFADRSTRSRVVGTKLALIVKRWTPFSAVDANLTTVGHSSKLAH